ncbi:unnamed protein product [Diplocarpon coronariae]
MAWIRLLEVWLTAKLLSSPAFHRAVKKIHKKVQEVKRGEKLIDPAETTNTCMERRKLDPQRFLRHYLDELKDQFKGTTKK